MRIAATFSLLVELMPPFIILKDIVLLFVCVLMYLSVFSWFVVSTFSEIKWSVWLNYMYTSHSQNLLNFSVRRNTLIHHFKKDITLD